MQCIVQSPLTTQHSSSASAAPLKAGAATPTPQPPESTAAAQPKQTHRGHTRKVASECLSAIAGDYPTKMPAGAGGAHEEQALCPHL